MKKKEKKEEEEEKKKKKKKGQSSTEIITFAFNSRLPLRYFITNGNVNMNDIKNRMLEGTLCYVFHGPKPFSGLNIKRSFLCFH